MHTEYGFGLAVKNPRIINSLEGESELKKSIRFICVLSLLLAVICSQASALPSGYEVTDLNALTGIPDILDVSASGTWVCGRTFAWSAETGLIKIGTLGRYNQVMAINDSGQVAGGSLTPNRKMHAFIWSPESGITDLNPLSNDHSWATGINNSGQAVGYSHTSGEPSQIFFWSPESGMIDICTLDSGSPQVKNFAINDVGQVIFFSMSGSFLWTEEAGMQDLSAIAGRRFRSRAINNAGQIAGDVYEGSARPAALLEPNGELIILGLLPGCDSSEASAINNRGQVVGRSWKLAPGISISKSFIWDPGTGMVDLNSLVALPAGFMLGSPSKIFDDGRIVCTMYTPNGYRKALLTPVATQVQIIVKNVINLKSKGNTPVAILASDTFDPSTVDPATVTLAGGQVFRMPNGRYLAAMNDVNRDGMKDLVLHIITQQMDLKPGNTKVVLEGSTFDGTKITGEATVKVLPHNK